MSAEVLREAAALMRERAKVARAGRWFADGPDVLAQWEFEARYIGVCDAQSGAGNSLNAEHIASWHPAVALAVAKAMDDVAHAWEIADEAADGYVYDADDNHYTFAETVDGGWLTVARAYLGAPE